MANNRAKKCCTCPPGSPSACCPCECHWVIGSGPAGANPTRRAGPQRPTNCCPCISMCFGIIGLIILSSIGCVIFNGVEGCLSTIGWCSTSGTKLENFACPLRPMSASILEIDCKTKTCPPKCCSRSLFFFKKCGHYYYPENILTKNDVDQWCFEGNQGAVTIKLGRLGHLKEFRMSSGSSSMDACVGNSNYEDSVRDFEIMAFGAGKKWMFTQTFRGKKTSEFQSFHISGVNAVLPIEHIKLIIYNNHGAPETKINRVSVMGFGKKDTKSR